MWTQPFIENTRILTFFTSVSLEANFTEAFCLLYGLPASSSDTGRLMALSCKEIGQHLISL